jgi:L-ribulokinase
MTSLKEKRFVPRPTAQKTYDELYAIYRQLHDAFGLPAEALAEVGGVAGASSDLGQVMKRLLTIKDRAGHDAA